MAGHIEHIIDAAGYPVIAVLITTNTVAGEKAALEGREISVDKALIIAIYRTHLSRPAVEYDQIAFRLTVQNVSLPIDNRWLNAEQRLGRRSRLQWRRSR